MSDSFTNCQCHKISWGMWDREYENFHSLSFIMLLYRNVKQTSLTIWWQSPCCTSHPHQAAAQRNPSSYEMRPAPHVPSTCGCSCTPNTFIGMSLVRQYLLSFPHPYHTIIAAMLRGSKQLGAIDKNGGIIWELSIQRSLPPKRAITSVRRKAKTVSHPCRILFTSIVFTSYKRICLFTDPIPQRSLFSARKSDQQNDNPHIASGGITKSYCLWKWDPHQQPLHYSEGWFFQRPSSHHLNFRLCVEERGKHLSALRISSYPFFIKIC